MAVVYGSQPYSALQIAQETTWGVASTGTYYTVPLVGSGETMRLQRDTITPPQIYGGTGAREIFEYGRTFVTGSFQIQARYDAKWFGILLANAVWGEEFVADTFVDGTTISPADSGNLHIYAPESTVPTGLTIKAFRGGTNASGTVETYTGCMVQSFTIEQRDGTALWTFNWLGKTVSVGVISGAPAAVEGAVFQNFRDLSRPGAYFKTGNSLTALGIDSFSLTFDNKIVIDEAFITAPDTVNQPGRGETRAVTLEINSRLEQDYYGNNRPFKEYEQKTSSKMDCLFKSATAVGDKTYALRLEMPLIYWDTDQHSLSSPGNPPTRWTATAVLGNFDVTSGLPGTNPGDRVGDFRILHVCKSTDDGDGALTSL